MKKFIIIIFSFIFLSLICIYFFIPDKLEFSKIEYIKGNVNGASRIVSNESNWQKWWPKDGTIKKMTSGEELFFYKGMSYQLTEKYYNSIGVRMKSDLSTIDSKLNFVNLNTDSLVIIWKFEIHTSMNPISRFLKYREVDQINNSVTDILSHLRFFLEDLKNIYGINFQIIMSKDSTMVLTKSISNRYPTTSDVYQLIGNLKKYIAGEHAKENNFPMLHVKKLRDSTFETMVAIPINKELQGNSKISFSRFVPWKVLTADVKGGNETVEEALKQMKFFMSDYEKTAMAIPFESLVTDRSKEPDTLKWSTRIYTPIP